VDFRFRLTKSLTSLLAASNDILQWVDKSSAPEATPLHWIVLALMSGLLDSRSHGSSGHGQAARAIFTLELEVQK
jgi:hypothetical protein